MRSRFKFKLRLRCQRQGLQLLVAEGRQCVWFGSQNVYVFKGDGSRATKQYLLVCFCYYAADLSQENRSSHGSPFEFVLCNPYQPNVFSQVIASKYVIAGGSSRMVSARQYQPSSVGGSDPIACVSADMSSPHSMASGSAESDSVTCVQAPRQGRDPTPVISAECP